MKRSMKRLILIAALACSSAQAEFKDGNRLLSQLQTSTHEYTNALGYIMGVADALQGVTHCPPVNVTAGQLADMVKQHLESLPGLRHLAADLHVSHVMKAAWPCAAKQGKPV